MAEGKQHAGIVYPDRRQRRAVAGIHSVVSEKNISSDITPYVTRITYSDNIKNESDTIEVELDDTDGRWLNAWYPGKGDTLTLKVGYRGEKLLSCGTFSIDEIEVSSPASVVSIRAWRPRSTARYGRNQAF